MKLKVGAKAPDFKMTDKEGNEHSLKSFAGGKVVLYFYPKDDTPGCTVEAQGFEAALPMFKKLGATVVGVSGGTNKTKEKFCDKQGLKNLLLLTDTDFSVAKKYDSFGEKKFMGRTYEGIFRNTFVIGEDGKILQVFESVNPKEHTDEVLEFLKES